MAINSVIIKDYLVFKNEFTAEFCSGVNVLIGVNGTGKSTIMKSLYDLKNQYLISNEDYLLMDSVTGMLVCEAEIENRVRNWGTAFIEEKIKNFIYIPEKDILEHAKGLLTFIEQKQTGFSELYKDVLISAQDIPTKTQTAVQKSIGEKISDIIGGHVEWIPSEGLFYTIKKDGMRIPFDNEASGYKKLGYLGLLVTAGQFEPGSVLFWDEPENSLNPEHIPVLVDILLELSRNGVQIFIATHSELLASYFAVNRLENDEVMFTSLYKEDGQIKANTSDRFDLIEPNNLITEPVKLYEKELEKGLGANE